LYHFLQNRLVFLIPTLLVHFFIAPERPCAALGVRLVSLYLTGKKPTNRQRGDICKNAGFVARLFRMDLDFDCDLVE